jgi:hypothetical protein
MAFNVSEMRSQLVGGGARPTLFEVQITNPINTAADFKIPFMVKAASLPASTIGPIEVPYFGRKIKIAGDRVFEDWEVTVINDEDFAVKHAMEQWLNAINSHVGNLRTPANLAPESYKTQAQVRQYSKTGTMIREYTFNGIFPTNIAAIETAWENNDAVEEFSLTLAYDWWESTGGTTGISTT